MKEIRMKMAKFMAYLYGTGIAVSFFAGALSFLGYLAAIVIGGQTAADICVFIYKKVYPVLFYLSSVSVILGMVKMYLAGEKTMRPTKRKS